MFCSACGKDVVEGARFCQGCGAEVTAGGTPTQASTAPPRQTTPFTGLIIGVAVLALAVALFASRAGSTGLSAALLAAPTTTPTQTPDEAIKAVIQQVNKEGELAFNTNDTTVIRAGGTSAFYNWLIQNNRRGMSNGMTAERLIQIYWGTITYKDPTHATATTTEVWQNTYADGTTQRVNAPNVYTLMQEQGVWLVDTDQVN